MVESHIFHEAYYTFLPPLLQNPNTLQPRLISPSNVLYHLLGVVGGVFITPL